MATVRLLGAGVYRATPSAAAARPPLPIISISNNQKRWISKEKYAAVVQEVEAKKREEWKKTEGVKLKEQWQLQRLRDKFIKKIWPGSQQLGVVIASSDGNTTHEIKEQDDIYDLFKVYDRSDTLSLRVNGVDEGSTTELDLPLHEMQHYALIVLARNKMKTLQDDDAFFAKLGLTEKDESEKPERQPGGRTIVINMIEKYKKEGCKHELDEKAAAFDTPWVHKSALVLERLPVVLPPPEPWEERWRQAQMEKQLKWNGKAMSDEYYQMVNQDRIKTFAVKDGRRVPLVGRYDIGDNFKPAPRTTKHDKSDNRRTLERALWNRLYLIVKRDRSEHAWQFPQRVIQDGETLRGCAEALASVYGPEARFWTPGNAPCGHLVYEHSKDYQKKNNSFGSKVFFYRFEYYAGRLEFPEDVVDFAWVTRDELPTYFTTEMTDVAKRMLWS
eukprot:Rmarinus@m.15647